MSIETGSGLHVVQAEAAEAAEVARIITEAAIWRLVEKGLNRWATDPEQNLQLASEAIEQGTSFLGYADGRAVASMFLSGPDETDKAVWGDMADDSAMYVHKLSVGVDGHNKRYGTRMLDAASGIAAQAGKTALRLHYIYAPQFAPLRQHYKEQGFVRRGRQRDGCCTTLELVERPVEASS